jgi:type I restriction enzyme S subunit
MEESYLSVETMLRTSPEIAKRFSRSTVIEGDIVYALRGKLGEVRQVNAEVAGANLTQGTARLSPGEDVCSDFLLWVLRSPSIIQQAELQAKGTTFREITLGDLRSIKIPVPSKREQNGIVESLGDADRLVALLEGFTVKKRAIKQGAMQELLTGKRRLPGFKGEWDRKTIGQVAEVKTGPFGSTLHERDYVSDGTPIITVEHLGESGVVHRNLPRVSEFDYRRLAAYSLQRFDIVFSRVGSVDRNALVRDPEVGWLFSGRLIRLRFKGGAAFPPFFNQYFHSEPFKERVRTVAVGQTMASLNTRLLGGVMVELPPLSEQCAIAAILAAMDEEIALWEAKLAKARQVKHGMMQELLTGRIRLV